MTDRFPKLLAACGFAIGAAAAVYYFLRGLTLSHYDAKAHLVVARRIFDSLTPGYEQIGAVWLPLPHLLNMLPVQNDLMYRTGASGVAISVLSFTLACYAIAAIVQRTSGSWVGALIAVGVVALGSLVWWLSRRKRQGKPALLDIGLFASKYFRLGITCQTLQQIALGGLMIALPIYLQMVLEYSAMGAGLSIAPLSLTMFAVALVAGRKAGNRSPSRIILVGFLLMFAFLALNAFGAKLMSESNQWVTIWKLVIPLVTAGLMFTAFNSAN